MTWEEHEKVYCRELASEPLPDQIYRISDSWSEVNNIIGHYESFEENFGLLFPAKYQNVYYAIRGEEEDFIFL